MIRPAALLALGLAAHCSPVAAQTACAPRDALVADFAEVYGEVVVAQAVAQQGFLVEVLVSPGGSWTLLVTRADGTTCLVANGQNWMARDPVVLGDPL